MPLSQKIDEPLVTIEVSGPFSFCKIDKFIEVSGPFYLGFHSLLGKQGILVIIYSYVV